jgi:riboflavin kinase/FMN adenylyltransferase
MKIITLKNNVIRKNTVAAIGFFDGVHIAHQKLIEKTIEIGKEKALETAIITFDVHPKTVLFGLDYRYITPFKRKLERLEGFNIDTIYVIEFTKEIASLHPKEFIKRYLTNLHTIVCGFDFKFGVRGSGNAKTLTENTYFETIIIQEITYSGYKIGSTHLRDLIQSGHVDQIPETLGSFYSIQGNVIHGDKKGRILGYPTANIETDHYLIPKTGVYVTMTKVFGKWYKSMTSVGHNPTLNCRTEVRVESYLFDFNKNIYNESIKIYFIKRLRDEIKFSSVETLTKQIDQDAIESLELLKKISNKLLA